MRRVLSVLVENEPGVLARISGLFSGRNYNIESISASPSHDPGTTYITITTDGEEQIFEQILKQLRKIISVIKVTDFSNIAAVERELALIKVHTDEQSRGEVLRIADIFRCKVIDISLGDVTLEVTGDHDKIKALTQLLQTFGIKEMAFGGTVAMRRSMTVPKN